MRKRLLFDILLTVVLVFEMLYQLTGNTLHEIVGVAFFVCIVAHVLFARRWIASTARAFAAGTVAKRQRRLLFVAVLLAVDVLLLMFSSLVISQKLWDAGIDLTFLNPGNIWYPIHTVTAYALCVLVLGHLVMHWASVADFFRIPYDPGRRETITSAASGIAMIGGIALGVAGAMRAGFQMSDYVVTADDAASTKTVDSGYRERDAQTGEYLENSSFEVASLSGESAASETDAQPEQDEAICPLCPRQCKLSAPRCERPYEAGLI